MCDLNIIRGSSFSQTLTRLLAQLAAPKIFLTVDGATLKILTAAQESFRFIVHWVRLASSPNEQHSSAS